MSGHLVACAGFYNDAQCAAELQVLLLQGLLLICHFSTPSGPWIGTNKSYVIVLGRGAAIAWQRIQYFEEMPRAYFQGL